MKCAGGLVIAFAAVLHCGYGKSILHKRESPQGIQEVDIVIKQPDTAPDVGQDLQKQNQSKGTSYSLLPEWIKRFFKLSSTSESAATKANEPKSRTRRSLRSKRPSKKSSKRRSSKPRKGKSSKRRPRKMPRRRPRKPSRSRSRRPSPRSRSREPSGRSRSSRRPPFDFRPPNRPPRFRSNRTRFRPSQQFQSGQSSSQPFPGRSLGETQFQPGGLQNFPPGSFGRDQQFMKGYPFL